MMQPNREHQKKQLEVAQKTLKHASDRYWELSDALRDLPERLRQYAAIEHSASIRVTELRRIVVEEASKDPNW